jgi:hypothetical protein
MTTETQSPLPGYMLRAAWAQQMGKCDRTAKRWQDAGRIVVRYMGKDPYVDLEATARRIRGEDRPRRNGRGQK